MRKFNVALCQMKVIDNKLQNLLNAKKMIENSIKSQATKPDLVILPEYFNCPVGQNYTQIYAEEESNSETLELLSSLAKQHKINIVGGSIPIKADEKYYNTCYCFNRDGEVKARHRKVHLFDIDIKGKITSCERIKQPSLK